MLVNLSVGMLTPPVGLNLFVAMGIARMSLSEIFRAAIPTILVMVVVGGFNRSSQHPVVGGVDDDRKTEIRALDAA